MVHNVKKMSVRNVEEWYFIGDEMKYFSFRNK